MKKNPFVVLAIIVAGGVVATLIDEALGIKLGQFGTFAGLAHRVTWMLWGLIATKTTIG